MSKSRRDYSVDERKIIIEYIIDKDGFYNLRGNAIWKQMEKEKILERTWQSMKEHFRMKIVNNLNLYDVSKDNQKKILAGYSNTRVVKDTSNAKTDEAKFKNFNFSDEETETSSDDSDNLVIEIEENSPKAKKGFKKQIIKSKPQTLISQTETVTSLHVDN